MASKLGLQRTYFDVLGLCCSSEVSLIENILKPLDGVKEVSVIVPTRTLIVVHDNLLVSQLQIVKALNQARLEANVRMYGDKDSQKMWPSPWAVVSGLLLVLSLLKYVFPPMQWLALGAVSIGIVPIVLKAITALRNSRFYDINILIVIAVIGTIALKDYLEAGTIVFLFTIAEWLQSRASHKTKVVMTSLMSISPKKAVISETGEEVDVDEVKLNTVIAVKAGEVIPIDGIVMDGNCEVDEKTLTGESFPVAKQKDSTVFAGTMNLNGYVSVKTTALAEDCVVAKMVKLVEDAQNNKSSTERIIDKYTKFYTPAVLLISILIAVIPAALRVKNQSHWFHLALVVLVSACPCALILSTPVATFCALTRAASSGLLIKGGNFLEILAKVKVMAFDKTGTITRAEFVVTNFQALQDDVTLNTLLYWVSSIESKSSHPMADAIVDYGKSLSIDPKPENVGVFENFPGEGVHGVIDGNDIYIGSRKIAARACRKTVPNLDEESKEGKSVGYIFCGGRLVGDLCLSDACRTGAEQAIKELKSMGIKTAMLTGDCNAAAMHAQKQLRNALEIVHADLLPEEKAKFIDQFKKEIGLTAMIGDGINDAPALATADIGISMGISGSALASETGNIILMSNDITKIPKAIRLSRRARNKVIQNVILSITTKLAILALSIAGHPLVWAAVLADVGTCLLVIFNSMTLLRGVYTPKKKHCCKSSGIQHSHGNQCSTTSNGLSSHDHQHGSHGSGHHHHHDDHHDRLHDDPHHHHESQDHHHHGTDNCHRIRKQCASKCSNDHHRPNEKAKALKSCTEAHPKFMDQGHGEEREKCHSNHCHDHEHVEPSSSDCGLNMWSGDEKKSDHSIIDCVGSDDVELEKRKRSCDDDQGSSSSSNSLKACCKSLDKREVAGCCKSYYMKECCANKHSHFGPGHSSGGLTEVVIE